MNDNFNDNDEQDLISDDNSINDIVDIDDIDDNSQKIEEITDTKVDTDITVENNDTIIEEDALDTNDIIEKQASFNDLDEKNIDEPNTQQIPSNPYAPPNFDPNQYYPPMYGYNPYYPPMGNMQSPYMPPVDPRFARNMPPIPPIPPMPPMSQMNARPPFPPYQFSQMPPNPDSMNGVNSNNSDLNKKSVIHQMGDFPNDGPTVACVISDNSKSKGFNFKGFSVFLIILLIISFSSFAYYFVNNDNANSYISNENSPSMEIAYTPDPIPNDDPSGVLTNNQIHEKVSPSVVGIAVYTKGLGNVLQSEGSGIVMSEDGFIITNYHVIANDSSNPVVKIEIIMSNSDTYEARVIGGDSKTDLAVVKIDAVDLIPAEFGDSSKLKIGDRVAVIGNPSGIAFAGSFTQGYVSALSRNIYMSDLNAEIEYIQTDAAINSGNSGGAFINEYGQIVGISAAKMRVEAGYEGMGFAIPINNAKIVIDSLIEHGYVAGRPRVGIEYKAISPTTAELNSIPVGLRVYTVGEEVDAFGKILAGDIITKFDGLDVYDSETVATALADKRSGESLIVTIYRVDEHTGVSEYIDVTIILSESVGEKLAETMN